jgi:O-antigen/teichoic acid export membrane protein
MFFGLLSGVLTARALGPTARGELVALQYFPGVIGSFCAMGFPERGALAIGNSHEGIVVAKRAIVGAITISVFVVSVIALLSTFTSIIPHVKLRTNFLIVILAGMVIPVLPVMVAILRASGLANKVNTALIANSASYSCLIVLLWTIGNNNPFVYALCGFVPMWIIGVYYYLVLPRNVSHNERSSVSWAKLYVDALRLFLPAVLMTALSQLDRAILLPTTNTADVGNFIVATAAASPLALGLEAVAQIGFADVGMASTSERKSCVILSRFRAAQVIAICGATGLFLVIRYLIIGFYGREYIQAVPMSYWLIAAYSFRALLRVLEYLVRGTNRTSVGLVSSLVTAAVMLSVGIPLARSSGAYGFSIALCISYFSGLIVAIFQSSFIIGLKVRDFWGLTINDFALIFRLLLQTVKLRRSHL